MLKEIICAGFGGQGVLTAGKIMQYVAHKCGFQVTWFPAYGNEMRGGTARCTIVISDERIANPISDHPDIVIALNSLSVDKHESSIKPNGLLLVNSSLVDESREYRSDITVVKSPVTEAVRELKNEKAINIYTLGKFAKETDIVSKEDFEKYMCLYFEEQGKGKFNAGNLVAFRAGYDEA